MSLLLMQLAYSLCRKMGGGGGDLRIRKNGSMFRTFKGGGIQQVGGSSLLPVSPTKDSLPCDKPSI